MDKWFADDFGSARSGVARNSFYVGILNSSIPWDMRRPWFLLPESICIFEALAWETLNNRTKHEFDFGDFFGHELVISSNSESREHEKD